MPVSECRVCSARPVCFRRAHRHATRMERTSAATTTAAAAATVNVFVCDVVVALALVCDMRPRLLRVCVSECVAVVYICKRDTFAFALCDWQPEDTQLKTPKVDRYTLVSCLSLSFSLYVRLGAALPSSSTTLSVCVLCLLRVYAFHFECQYGGN